MKYLEQIFLGIVIFLGIDFVCFMMWAFSGQFPQTNFYFGMLTRLVLKTLLF